MGNPTRTRIGAPGSRFASWALAVVLVLAGALVLSASPAAVAAPGGPVLGDAIQAEWDGPTTHLDWRGRGYATAEATFVGDRVAVPGDRVQRTLNVTNDGPSGAVMTVSIIVDQTVPDTALNPDLAQDITLFWDAGGAAGQDTFAALLAAPDATTQVAQVPVSRGDTVPITAGFAMGRDATGGRNGAAESTVLTFTVVVHLRGDTERKGPGLVVTGADVTGPAALGLGVLGVGLLLLLARRRRCDGCGRRIRWRERWTLTRLPGAGGVVQCVDCVDAAPGTLPARA